MQYVHIMNTKAVKYSQMFMNSNTGYEYYNLLYFQEQQSLSNCTKPITVCYCLV